MQKISSGVVSDPQSSLSSLFRKTVLPNGIRVVTEQIPYVRSISIGVWVEVGSRDEDEQNNGISHFLEHMVFKGTKHYSARNIARSLESYGGYLNAFTSKEHTCFYARALDAHLEEAVRVISDLAQFPIIDKKELEKEKSVVIEELKNLEDDPDDLILDYFDKSVYHKHPLAFPVIGTAENIRRFSQEDLFGFLEKHYVPHRMVVAASGNITHEKVVELVMKYFNGSGVTASIRHQTPSPRMTRASLREIERPITQAHICLGTLGYSVKHKTRYPLLVLNTLLGEGMSSRLFQSLREKHGYAYSVYSFTNTMSDTGSFGVYMGTDSGHVNRAIDLIYQEFENLQRFPVGKAELKRTKAQLKGTIMLSLESMSSRMMRIGSGELYYGQNIPLDGVIAKIDAVTSDEILALASKLFRRENFSTVIIKPSTTTQNKERGSLPHRTIH